MFRKENLVFFFGIFIVIILLLISQFSVYSQGFYSIGADEAGHTLEAFQWYKGQASVFSIWLPFQKIFYGISFNIYYDLFWVPRILSSFFGILTLLSLIFLTYELFQNRIVSLIAGFLASIYYCLVIFSIIPMIEIYFFFFVITSIAFFLHWKRTNHSVSLLLTIIFLIIGTTTRYEAWIFSFSLFILIIVDIFSINGELPGKIFKTIGLFIAIFSFPMLWIYLSHNATGESTKFFYSVVERYSPGGIIAEFKNNVLYNFLITNIFSLNILGIITLIFFYNKKIEIKVYALIFLSTLLVFSIVTFITKAMPTQNSWRIASIWSIMLLPFTAQWLYLLLSDKNIYLKYNFIIFVLILIYFFTRQTLDFSKTSYMNREDLVIGRFIHNELNLKNPASRIFIEQNGWKYSSLLVTSQMPDRFIIKEGFYNQNELIKNYKKYNVEYLILKPGTQLVINSEDLKEVKKYHDWIIYKLPL